MVRVEMSSENGSRASRLSVGRVLSAGEGFVVFNPLGSRYELQLATAGRYDGPLNQRISCLIRARAARIFTVPSGGSFIVPIVGSTRIIQGLVRHVGDGMMVVHAGVPIIIELPADESAWKLESGPLAPGAMVNIVVAPGVAFEAISQPAAA
jgi:hypothetical protein